MKKYFIAGILVWVPIAITVWVITWGLGLIDQIYGSVMGALITVLPGQFSGDLRHFREIPGLGILIVIAVITDNFWQNLKQVVNCAAFDDPALDGQPGRWADREMINARLNELLSVNSCAHWLGLFEAQRIPCAPVNRLSQALADTQVLHRNMVVDLKHPNGNSTKGPGNPIKLSRSSDEVFTAAPTLGQHTDEVMTQLLNLSVEQIQQMKDQGIIK